MNSRSWEGFSFSTVPSCDYLLSAVATSTAQATVQPTIGLLPMPRNPIISTCAGTDEEPANCASASYSNAKLALNLHNPWKILILQEICE